MRSAWLNQHQFCLRVLKWHYFRHFLSPTSTIALKLPRTLFLNLQTLIIIMMDWNIVLANSRTISDYIYIGREQIPSSHFLSIVRVRGKSWDNFYLLWVSCDPFVEQIRMNIVIEYRRGKEYCLFVTGQGMNKSPFAIWKHLFMFYSIDRNAWVKFLPSSAFSRIWCKNDLSASLTLTKETRVLTVYFEVHQQIVH